MFNDILKTIVEGTGGGAGAVLMGYDGIAVDHYFRDGEGADLQMVAIEYAGILKEIKKAAEILDTGAVEEVTVKTPRFHLVLRALTDDYFVALALDPGGNFGKGRFLLMREAHPLREALA